MTKQSGLGDAFWIDGYDLSGDVGSLNTVRGGVTPLEVTGIDKSAMERIPGQRDSELAWSTWFNPATGAQHDVLSTLPLTRRIGTYCRGTSIGSWAASLMGKQLNYDPTRGDDGSLTIAIQMLGGEGVTLEWGQLLTAGKRTDTGATDGASLDGAASSAFGASAYLQVFSFSGADATIKLQDSANNSAWSDISGGGFTAVTTGPQPQRIALAAGATVRRYTRVITTTSGGFSSLVFGVSLVRNLAAVVAGNQ